MTIWSVPKPAKREKTARAPIPRAGRPNPKKKRTAAETRDKFAREFGSKERVQFVESLPCCACGVVGFSQNAHVGNEGAGGSLKANYDQIAPLCGPRWKLEQGNIRRGPRMATIPGCHRLSHRGQQTFERQHDIDFAECAEETERAWLAHCEAGQ